VIDAVGEAPGGYGIGHKLPIIGHEDLKGPVKLCCYMFVLVLQN